MLARLTYSESAWYASAEYNHREPAVAANSIFSIIEYRHYKDFRFAVRYRVRGLGHLGGQCSISPFVGEDSWRTTIGFGAGFYTFGWRHQAGHGGDNDGLYGSVMVRPARDWECYAVVDISRYRVQLEQEDRNDAYSSALGVRHRFGREFEVRVEGQLLRNAIEKYNARLYLKLSKNFSFKPDAGGD